MLCLLQPFYSVVELLVLLKSVVALIKHVLGRKLASNYRGADVAIKCLCVTAEIVISAAIGRGIFKVSLISEKMPRELGQI